MHMGNISSIGNFNSNMIYILLNNNHHESVGGQTTNSFNTKFHDIAKACNFNKTFNIFKKDDLIKILSNKEIIDNGPIFIEVKINSGTIENLGRPDNSFRDIKNKFMNDL